MSKEYLDKTGLAHLWSKIKNYTKSKFNSLKLVGVVSGTVSPTTGSISTTYRGGTVGNNTSTNVTGYYKIAEVKNPATYDLNQLTLMCRPYTGLDRLCILNIITSITSDPKFYCSYSVGNFNPDDFILAYSADKTKYELYCRISGTYSYKNCFVLSENTASFNCVVSWNFFRNVSSTPDTIPSEYVQLKPTISEIVNPPINYNKVITQNFTLQEGCGITIRKASTGEVFAKIYIKNGWCNIQAYITQGENTLSNEVIANVPKPASGEQFSHWQFFGWEGHFKSTVSPLIIYIDSDGKMHGRSGTPKLFYFINITYPIMEE